MKMGILGVKDGDHFTLALLIQRGHDAYCAKSSEHQPEGRFGWLCSSHIFSPTRLLVLAADVKIWRVLVAVLQLDFAWLNYRVRNVWSNWTAR